MSELSAIQIPKPRDAQAFERCNEALWRCILNDDNVQCYGRSGQSQHGVDLVGRRGGKSDRIVGIQCKLKGEGQFLSEGEVRDEVRKAMGFEPPLSEYIIVTTAPDDARLQSVALELSLALRKDRGRELSISIYGWNSLEREISRYPEALNAFDPTHTPHSDRVERKIEDLPANLDSTLSPRFDAITSEIATLKATQVDLIHTAIYREYDQLIDVIRELLPTSPATALNSLQELKRKLGENAPNHIRFRVTSNIAACHLELGDEEKAANGFIAAWEFSPDDPKAIANKAFGFFLKKDWDSIRAFAETRISANPENAELSACYVLSLKFDESVDDPIALIPEPARHSPQVAEAHVNWLIERGAAGAWWDAAIAAREKFPERAELKDLYASALLSRATSGIRFIDEGILDKVARSDVEDVIRIFRVRWVEVRDRTIHRWGDQTFVPLNLIAAYRLLDRSEEASRVGLEALERFPDSVAIRELVAETLVEQGDMDRALQLISELDLNSDTVMMRYNIAIYKRDWTTVLSLVETQLEIVPRSERGVLIAGGVLARTLLAPREKRRSIVEAELENVHGDTRALTNLAQLARLNRCDDLSESLFEAAKSALKNGDDGPRSRFRFAAEAMDRRRLDIVAETLFDRVPLDRDSEPTRMLAYALVYNIPIRQRASRFFEGLQSNVLMLPYFRYLEGVLHFNRGMYQDAVCPFTAAFEQQPSLDNLLCLIRSLHEIKDDTAVVALLQRESVDALPGSPLERMEFSHLLSEYSEYSRAIDLGYEALTGGLDNPDMVMKYLGLVFNSTWDRHDHGFDGTVATGVWVHLTETNGKESKGLIGESANRPWGEKIELTNSFFPKSLGLKIGEVFEHVNSLGVAEKWTVSEVRPCWLQAFYHLFEGFGQRFPDAPGFASITAREDDIEPILEQVRRLGKSTRENADLYLVKGLPIALVSGDSPGADIAFAQYLKSIGEQVRVCTGVAKENEEALALIQRHNRSGVVLDGFTAWHAATMDIFPVLQERLGTLAIPVSEMGRLKAMTNDHFGGNDGETVHLEYRDGQYVRHIETADQRADRICEITARITKIEDACEVVAVEFPDQLSELGERLLEHSRRDAFAPAVVAGESRLLLSEDLMMRQVSSRAFGSKGIWLQVVLESAVRAGTMPLSAYTDAVVYVAHQNHGRVLVNIQVFLAAFQRDETPGLCHIEALCAYFGGSEADPHSHTSIGAEFVNVIWENAVPIVWTNDLEADSKALKATDLVFRALIGNNKNEEWAPWAAKLFQRLDDAPRRYLIRWCDENFFSYDQLLDALRKEAN